MTLMNLVRKHVRAIALLPLLQLGFLLAPGQANAVNGLGDVVTCAGSGSCYDFTVYDARVLGNPTASSKGFFEGFVTYSGTGTVTPVLTNAYFIASGMQTPGATASSWAPILSNPTFNTTLGSAPTLSTSTGRFGNNTVIDFQVGTTFYSLALQGSGDATIKFSSISSADAYNNGDSLSSGQLFYTSTTAANALGTSGAFGGQIAPEMDAASALNVFALLACLALIYSKRKYFSQERLGNGVAIA